MAKTLSFTDTSPQTVKIGDTTTSFTLVCGNDNVAVDLTSATSITVKLGNDSGYLKSATVDPTSLTDPTTGQVTVTFNADLMTSLPADSYILEVWVVDSTGTSIYPSDGSTGFTITNNIQSTTGSTITTITFDDFVAKLNEVASTIKGEKGDPGEGLDIKGQVTAVSALPTTANEGDGYLVNEELYVYASGAWKDCGAIRGPQGIQGKAGTGISSTTIQYQISNSATTAPTGTWSNDIVATTTANPYLWMKATLNYTDNTTKDFYLISQKGDKGDKGDTGLQGEPGPTGPQGVKGDKGDTGTVDNSWLTTAPAFVELQTQVDDSAVGTNLLAGTSDFTGWTLGGGTEQGTTDGLTYAHLYSGTSVVAPSFTLAESTTYTVSFDALGYIAGTTPIYIGYSEDSSGNIIASDYVNATLNAIDGTSTRVSLTFTTTSSFTKTNFNIGCGHDYSAGGSVFIRHVKLELGSHATDWCHNPSDILTQADYAKIKAAIVALGGSLS